MRLTKVKQFPYLINEKANEWLRTRRQRRKKSRP